MYLPEFRRHLSDDMVKTIENTSTFKVFLVRFWLHNMQEYYSFSDKEKSICIQEYIRYKSEKDPKWLTSIITLVNK
jgi:hypothetical protein